MFHNISTTWSKNWWRGNFAYWHCATPCCCDVRCVYADELQPDGSCLSFQYGIPAQMIVLLHFSMSVLFLFNRFSAFFSAASTLHWKTAACGNIRSMCSHEETVFYIVFHRLRFHCCFSCIICLHHQLFTSMPPIPNIHLADWMETRINSHFVLQTFWKCDEYLHKIWMESCL